MSLTIQKKQFWLGGTPAEPATTFTTPSLVTADNVLFFCSACNKANYQELGFFDVDISVNVPYTMADAEADPVGFMYDLGPNAFTATAVTAGSQPSLTFTSGRSSGMNFASELLNVQNSQSSLKSMHANGQQFSWAVWAKKSTDGTTMYLNSNATSTAHYGILFNTTAANKIVISCVYGSAGNYRFLHTSTATFTIADGWTPIIVTIGANGAGNGTLYIGDKTPETFTINAVGAMNNATYDLCWGATASAYGSRFNGFMDCLTIQNRVLTAPEIAAFKAYNPASSTDSFLTKSHEFDFNDTATMWSDTTRTTPIVDGVGVALVDNKASTTNFGPRLDYLIQAVAGKRPLYDANIINGLGIVDFDGVDDDLAIQSLTARGGAFVYFFVERHTKLAAAGDHIMFSDTDDAYIAITDNNYVSGDPLLISPYIAAHQDVGTSDTCAVNQSITSGYRVTAIRRNGNETKLYTDAGNNSYTSVKQYAFASIGRPANGSADWWKKGPYAKVVFYYGYMTDAQVTAAATALRTAYN